MIIRKKLYILCALLLVIVLAMLVFPASEHAVAVYNRVMYYPVQWFRDLLLGFVPFSVGDVVYVLGGAVLLVVLVRWVRYIIHFKNSKMLLWGSLLNTVNVVLFVYLCFIFGWGVNYYKEPLAKRWDLQKTTDTLHLAQYDSALVVKMNRLAPWFRHLSLREVNAIAQTNYARFSDSRLSAHGLNIKPSLFGYFLDRMAIQGYYNPFTGEGQVSSTLPDFMMPFVVSHEMAHQAGIAAEGDANLMAYAIASTSGDSTFRYSAYLSIWLYVDRRLHRKDSVLANKFSDRLNALTKQHIETLDSLSELYDNDFSKYGNQVYDSYLKMQQQKDGVKSYGSVVYSAWLLDRRRSAAGEAVLHVP